MNILVVTDIFAYGGLETHINTFYDELKKNNNVIICTSAYQERGYVKGAKIIDGFKFSANSTIKEFLSDVDMLVKVIKENKIDVIHCHPFYSLFPAIFAASITNTKLVYTYHGRASINFVNYYNDSILFDFAIETIIQKVFCVSSNGIPWFNSYNRNQAILFPNVINEREYQEHKVVLNKTWALISRLDDDKYSEIIKLFTMLPNLDIAKVDIYGDGTKKEDLINFVNKKGLDKKVKFKGYITNINDVLKEYTGVIGLGRVAIESLTMNYPTLLIGFDKIVGMIDANLYNEVKDKNFVPIECLEIDAKSLNKKIQEINKGHYKNYQLRDRVIADMGIKKIADYEKILADLNPISLQIYDSILKDIKGKTDKEELFYSSSNVFKILQAYIGSYTNNILLKKYLLVLEKDFQFESKLIGIINNQVDQKDKDIRKHIAESMLEENKNLESLKQEIIVANNKISKLENISLLTLIKRDFTKLIYRIKRIFKR